MSRSIVLVAASAVLFGVVSASSLALAQPRRPLGWADVNRDGVITREEFDQVRARRFERLDTNKDGVVTREEFMAAEVRAFERLDRNKDGKITPDELPPRRGRR